MNRNIIISIVIAILAIGAVVYWQNDESAQDQEELYVPKTARAGRLVTGFPETLVLTEDNKIISSHVTKLGSGRTSYVATINTEEDYKIVYFKYVEYLPNEGFEISSRPFFDDRASVFASKGANSFSINISKTGEDRSQLTLTWVELKI